MTPLVYLGIDRNRLDAAWVLRDDDFGATLIQLGDDRIAVESLVSDQRVEFQAVDQRGESDRFEALAGQQHETDEIAQCVGKREYLGGHAALGTAYGLALSPPFAP